MKLSHRPKEAPPQWTIDFRAEVEIPIRILEVDYKLETVKIKFEEQEVVVREGELLYVSAPFEFKRK